MKKPAVKPEIETEADSLPGRVSARIVITVEGATLDDLRQALADALAGVREPRKERGARARRG